MLRLCLIARRPPDARPTIWEEPGLARIRCRTIQYPALVPSTRTSAIASCQNEPRWAYTD